MNNETAVTVPAEIVRDIETRQAWARSLVVTSPAMRTEVMEIVRAVKVRAKTIVESFEESCAASLAAHRANLAHRDSFLKPLAEIESCSKAAVRVFDEQQERIRLAEQRRLQTEADEKARNEQARLDALAAAQRAKEEAARKAEAEARQRAQEATNAEARRLALIEAEKARKQAETAAAAATVREEAAADLPPPPVVTVAPAAQAVKGESAVKVWKYRITDPLAVPRDYLMIDETKLGAVVRATKGTLPIAGVEIYSENSIRVRA